MEKVLKMWMMLNITLGEVCHMDRYFQIQFGVAIRIM